LPLGCRKAPLFFQCDQMGIDRNEYRQPSSRIDIRNAAPSIVQGVASRLCGSSMTRHHESRGVGHDDEAKVFDRHPRSIHIRLSRNHASMDFFYAGLCRRWMERWGGDDLMQTWQKKTDHVNHGRFYANRAYLFQICVSCPHFFFRDALLMNDMRDGGFQED